MPGKSDILSSAGQVSTLALGGDQTAQLTIGPGAVGLQVVFEVSYDPPGLPAVPQRWQTVPAPFRSDQTFDGTGPIAVPPAGLTWLLDIRDGQDLRVRVVALSSGSAPLSITTYATPFASMCPATGARVWNSS